MEKEIFKLLKTAEGESFDKLLLNEIFTACKALPSNITKAHSVILSKMDEKQHSQLRLNGLELINILFLRSKQFQSLVLQHSQSLLRLCLDDQLEPKRFTAKLERRITKLIVEEWKSQSPQFEVLKKHVLELTKSRNWLDQASLQSVDVQDDAATIRSKQIKFDKYKALAESFGERRIKISSYQTQLTTAMDLLLPQIIPSAVSSSSSIVVPLRGVLEIQVNTSITETTENSILFDAVRENLNLLRTFHGQVDEWLQLVSMVDHHELDKKQHESFLKELIDFKVSVLNCTLKAQDLLDNAGIESDSEEEFEQVDMNAVITDAAKIPTINNDLSRIPMETVSSSTKLAPVFKGRSFTESQPKCEADLPQLIPKHLEQLYNLAPVVEYGEDLKYWSKKPTNLTFDQLSKHGGLEFKHRFLGESSASDKIVSEETVNTLLKRTIYVPEKELLVPEYPACGVLGKNGKICQRRDIERCPFHGIIKPRDKSGKLLSGEDESSMIPIWQQIESQVYIPKHARSVQKKSSHVLEAIPKKKSTHSQRLMKKSKRLLKSGNDINEVTLRERDRQVFRW